MGEIKLKPKEEIAILRRIIQNIHSGLNLEQVLKKTIEIILQVTKGDSCRVYLFSEKRDELILSASNNPDIGALGNIRIKPGEGITGLVAKEKEVVAISKNAEADHRFKFLKKLSGEKYQSFFSVPVKVRDEIVGVINVRHKQEHEFTPEETALVSTVALQAGYAVENIRLLEETKRRNSQLEKLAEISTTIVSNRYLKEILHLIVTMTAEMMGSKICSIMILDEKKQELIIEATQSLSEAYIKKPPLKIGESISGTAVKEKKPITVLNVTKEAGYKYPRIAEKEGIYSMLAVPMMIKDRVIGVINSYTATEHKFKKDEIEILQAVANQAAVAIENTNLVEEALVAREDLETRKKIERAKGILMKDLGIGEDEAYRTIHRKSMDIRRPMKEIAEAIILSSDIRKNICSRK
ncbi:MAG: GAF domain-containing protein [bacterium]